MDFFIRHISRLESLPNRTPVRAYDTRFLFILSGRGELRLPSRTVEISENALCYYPAGTEYFPVSSPDAPLSVITVNFDFSREYIYRTASHKPVPLSEPFDERELKPTHLSFAHERFHEPFVLEGASHLRESFVRMEFEKNSLLPYADERAESLLSFIIYSILLDTPKQSNALYRRLCDYLNEHYAHIRSNEEVARALNYHESYLNKVLKEYAGITVHQFINQRRLKEAELLLVSSSDTVEQISERVGFINTKHFSTLFRAAYGISPSQSRKRGKWI